MARPRRTGEERVAISARVLTTTRDYLQARSKAKDVKMATYVADQLDRAAEKARGQ